MKVVINTCFGGFGLSPEATKLYAEKKGKECHFYALKMHGNDKEIPTPPQKDMFWHAYFSDTQEDSSHIEPEDDRSDPDLVSVVEELGHKASAGFASLKIVEIPDGVEYVIGEYDGIEHIAEKHRTWG